MKNLLTLAIILSSATAFATRARLTALGNAAHLTDVTTVFTNPADMTSHKDSLTLETGSSNITYVAPILTSATNTAAEGLLIRSMGDAKIGFALGHDNKMVFVHRYLYADSQGYAAPLVITQQNPFTLMYAAKSGDMAWGASLDYSNFNNKTAGAEMKESSMGLNFGARSDAWDVAVNLLLANTWEAGTTTKSDLKGNTGFTVSGGYNVSSDMYVYGKIVSGGFKSTIANVDDVNYEQMDMMVGVLSTVKQDANEFFYGIGLQSTSLNQKTAAVGAAKGTAMALPLIIGLEADAATWLTLRGSITQSVLINDRKVSPDVGNPTTDLSPAENSTTFAAGAGLKFASVTLDGSILSGGAQNLDAGNGNLFGKVGLTYNF